MNSDLQRIDDYGQEHSEAYGGHWIQDGRAYGVSFTGSVENHEAALRALLNLPDRLRVTQCTYSHAYLREMQQTVWDSEVTTNPDGTVQTEAVVGIGVDVPGNVLRVRVLPGHPDAEERLISRYGPIISIEIGGRAKAL